MPFCSVWRRGSRRRFVDDFFWNSNRVWVCCGMLIVGASCGGTGGGECCGGGWCDWCGNRMLGEPSALPRFRFMWFAMIGDPLPFGRAMARRLSLASISFISTPICQFCSACRISALSNRSKWLIFVVPLPSSRAVRGGFGGAYMLGTIYRSLDDSPSLLGLNFGKLSVRCTGNALFGRTAAVLLLFQWCIFEVTASKSSNGADGGRGGFASFVNLLVAINKLPLLSVDERRLDLLPASNVWFRSKQIFRPAQNRSNDSMPLTGVTRRKQSITPCGNPLEPSSCQRASMSTSRTKPVRLSSIISNSVRMLDTNFFGKLSRELWPLLLPPPGVELNDEFVLPFNEDGWWWCCDGWCCCCWCCCCCCCAEWDCTLPITMPVFKWDTPFAIRFLFISISMFSFRLSSRTFTNAFFYRRFYPTVQSQL